VHDAPGLRRLSAKLVIRSVDKYPVIPCIYRRHRLYKGISVPESVDCGAEPRMTLGIVMVKPRDKGCVEEAARREGLKLVPYAYFSQRCTGFFVHSLDEARNFINRYEDCIDLAGVVNTVWYARLPFAVNLMRLTEAGFVFHPSNMNSVMAVVDYVAVRVFYSGTVGLHGPLLESDARLWLGKVCYVIRKYGAVI